LIDIKKVCWEKFARYFEVELKDVKLRDGYYVMDPEKAMELVDENTICVCAILGSTYNGEFEDVKRLNELLEKKNKQTGYKMIISLVLIANQYIYIYI
jgi:glutamate decarboxylase